MQLGPLELWLGPLEVWLGPLELRLGPLELRLGPLELRLVFYIRFVGYQGWIAGAAASLLY